MRTILVIGGTTEARTAAARLESNGFRVVVSVATGLGELYAGDHEIISGGKNDQELAAQARRWDADAVVDCSHPFALAAGRASRGAAASAGIPYLRFTRPRGIEEGVEVVSSWEEAVEALRRRGERALLTIGVRHLEPFVAAGLDLAARVLPMPESVGECLRLGLRPEDIIAAFPPHDVEFNRACIRKTGARVLVSKDSGGEGGTPEKIEAASAEGAHFVMISRPREEDGIHDIDELMERLGEVLPT